MILAKLYIPVCLCLVLVACSMDPMNMKRHLPTSASDVHEALFESGIDYARYMKAKITHNEYLAFAEELGYTNIVSSSVDEDLKRCRLYPNLRWQEEKENEWWDLRDEELLGCFYKINVVKESYSILKYSNGYLYYKFMKM